MSWFLIVALLGRYQGDIDVNGPFESREQCLAIARTVEDMGRGLTIGREIRCVAAPARPAIRENIN